MANDCRRRDAGQDGINTSNIHCGRCNDTRMIAESRTCWACDGFGKYGDDVVCGTCDATGNIARQIECPDCPANDRVPESRG